jgi:hypothetical protein
MSFPWHEENIPIGVCAGCHATKSLPWHFGVLQEILLCNGCGNERWELLLAKVGRLSEWLKKSGGYF